MPNISLYLLRRFGISVFMYFGDQGQHRTPHIHARKGSEEAVFAIPSGEVLTGLLPRSDLRKVQAWIVLNEEALMERWQLAVDDQPFDRID